jgi:small-conductance mechanosensitive channel
LAELDRMLKKLIKFLVLAGLAALSWFVNRRYPNVDLTKVASSFTAIAASYLVLKVGLEGTLGRRIPDSKARYSFRKTVQALFLGTSAIIVLRIWVVDAQALLVAYGLVGAGVAIALQDVFKNFAGALAIFLSGIYRVGDRIEVDSHFGDVIDLGLFYTTLLELRGWVDGDQTTGRITLLPNGEVLSSPVHNYTKDHSFLWDEFVLPITYGSNWKKAVDIIQTIVRKETAGVTEQAEREISRLQEKYYLSKRNIEPMVFVTPTDNWVALHVRYVVPARDRRILKNDLSKLVLDALLGSDDIKIASQTLTVTTIAVPPS